MQKIQSNNVNFGENHALRDISLSMKENTVTALMDHQDVVNVSAFIEQNERPHRWY
jgi:ABC-type phosphate transport system ATPase subunit